MAQKKITDLTAVGAFTGALNFPVDNAIQTYRATGAQLLDYIDDNILTNDMPALVKNLGLLVSVGSNALTIAVKNQAGSNASSTSAVQIGFRHATITTGTPVIRSVTAALSVVVPSGATLGHVSAVPQYAYIYAIDNSGTVEVAISSSVFDDGSVVSTTAVDTASDSKLVMYSTTARSNVPCRLIGRILSTQTTAGTWAAAITEVTLTPRINPIITEWEIYTPTYTGFGTVSTSTMFKRRVGDSQEIQGTFLVGTSTAVEARMTLPSGVTPDNSKINATIQALDGWVRGGVSANLTGYLIVQPSTAYLCFGVVTAGGSDPISKANGSSICSSGETLQVSKITVPVSGWNTYGP